MATGSFISTITVEELSAASGQQPRILTLSGPALPFMGAEWAMKSRVITTWYQGNPDEATQQVLGPMELPSRWSGEWNRTRMGKSPSGYQDDTGAALTIIAPNDLVTVFESIARDGQRLRVTWSQQVQGQGDTSGNGKIVREGRMTELKFKYTRMQDIAWEIEFEWMSRGGTVSRVTSTRANTVTNNSQAYQNAVLALIQANVQASLAYQKPGTLTIGQLEAFANYPSNLVNSMSRSIQQITSQVGDLVDLATTIASQPVQIANRAVDLARNTVSQLNSFSDSLGQIPYEFQSTQTKVHSLVKAWNSFSQQNDLAQAATAAGQTFAAQLEQQAQAYVAGQKAASKLTSANNVDQVYIVKDGDTLESISQKFFGTPDHGVDILKTNGLSWYTPTLPKGKIILIPVLPTSNPTQGV